MIGTRARNLYAKWWISFKIQDMEHKAYTTIVKYYTVRSKKMRLLFLTYTMANKFNTVSEWDCKEQLNRKRFEIYQTISWFGAFLLTLSLHNITKLASKSIKLSILFQIIIESICIKVLSTLLKNIHTSPSNPSLTYLWVQLFPVPYALPYFCIVL